MIISSQNMLLISYQCYIYATKKSEVIFVIMLDPFVAVIVIEVGGNRQRNLSYFNILILFILLQLLVFLLVAAVAATPINLRYVSDQSFEHSTFNRGTLTKLQPIRLVDSDENFQNLQQNFYRQPATRLPYTVAYPDLVSQGYRNVFSSDSQPQSFPGSFFQPYTRARPYQKTSGVFPESDLSFRYAPGSCSPGQLRSANGHCITPAVPLYEAPGISSATSDETLNNAFLRFANSEEDADEEENADTSFEVTSNPHITPPVIYVNYNDGQNVDLPGGIDLATALSGSVSIEDILTDGRDGTINIVSHTVETKVLDEQADVSVDEADVNNIGDGETIDNDRTAEILSINNNQEKIEIIDDGIPTRVEIDIPPFDIKTDPSALMDDKLITTSTNVVSQEGADIQELQFVRLDENVNGIPGEVIVTSQTDAETDQLVSETNEPLEIQDFDTEQRDESLGRHQFSTSTKIQQPPNPVVSVSEMKTISDFMASLGINMPLLSGSVESEQPALSSTLSESTVLTGQSAEIQRLVPVSRVNSFVSGPANIFQESGHIAASAHIDDVETRAILASDTEDETEENKDNNSNVKTSTNFEAGNNFEQGSVIHVREISSGNKDGGSQAEVSEIFPVSQTSLATLKGLPTSNVLTESKTVSKSNKIISNSEISVANNNAPIKSKVSGKTQDKLPESSESDKAETKKPESSNIESADLGKSLSESGKRIFVSDNISPNFRTKLSDSDESNDRSTGSRAFGVSHINNEEIAVRDLKPPAPRVTNELQGNIKATPAKFLGRTNISDNLKTRVVQNSSPLGQSNSVTRLNNLAGVNTVAGRINFPLINNAAIRFPITQPRITSSALLSRSRTVIPGHNQLQNLQTLQGFNSPVLGGNFHQFLLSPNNLINIRGR